MAAIPPSWGSTRSVLRRDAQNNTWDWEVWAHLRGRGRSISVWSVPVFVLSDPCSSAELSCSLEGPGGGVRCGVSPNACSGLFPFLREKMKPNLPVILEVSLGTLHPGPAPENLAHWSVLVWCCIAVCLFLWGSGSEEVEWLAWVHTAGQQGGE